MSIPVDLAELHHEIARIATSAFLVTNATNGPPHVASVRVSSDGEHLAMGAGRKTRANAAVSPAVTLVWPAAIDPDYCLIVDGIAIDAPPDTFLVRATSAVLHRKAEAP